MRLCAFLSDERCLAPVGTSTEKRNFGRRFSGKNRLRTDVCRSDGFARPFTKSDLRVPLPGNGPKCPCLDRSGDRFLSVPEGNRHSMRKACRSEYTSHCGVARWIGGKDCVRFLCPGTREVPRSMLRFIPTGVHEKRIVRHVPDTSSCFGSPELFRVAEMRRRSRGVGLFLSLFRFSSGFSPPDPIRSSGGGYA